MSKVKSTGDFDSLDIADGRIKIHQRDPIKPRDNFYIDELPWTEKQKRFIDISLDRSTRLILCKGYGKVFKTGQVLDNEFKGWLKDYFINEI